MEYQFTYSKADQKKQYIFGYYNRPILWIQRKVLGPIIMILAVLLILISPTLTNTLISIMFILFGAYYTFRVYIMLLRIKFNDSKLKFIFNETELIIENESGKLNVKRKDILKIKRKRNYVFIQILLNYKQYYIVDLDKLDKNEEEFIKELSIK